MGTLVLLGRMARQGKAWQGKARQGKARPTTIAKLGVCWGMGGDAAGLFQATERGVRECGSARACWTELGLVSVYIHRLCMVVCSIRGEGGTKTAGKSW